MRARVFAEDYPTGRAWVYEVYDPDRPVGHQGYASGMRQSWREALMMAQIWLSNIGTRASTPASKVPISR